MLTLQAAAWFGDADNVKLLLDRGAKTNTEPIGYYGHELQGTHHSIIITNFANFPYQLPYTQATKPPSAFLLNTGRMSMPLGATFHTPLLQQLIKAIALRPKFCSNTVLM